MNPRQPIYAILAFGLAAAAALSFAPYSLIAGARQTAENYTDFAREHAAPLALVRAEKPRPAPPSFDAAAWYAGRGEDPEGRGVLIETADGARTLAAHNAERPFNPASLVKLATSLAALKQLGAEYRFETRVYIDGAVDSSGSLKGRLVVAGGDPTFGDVSAVLVAKELSRRGVKRVAGELVVTPDFTFNFSEDPEDSAARLAKVTKLAPGKLSVGEAPSGAPVFVARSYPLRDILFYMNAHSSNFMAQRVGALVGGAEGVRSFLVAELGLAPEQVSLATTSGLGQNRLTPKGLIAVIRALRNEAARQGLSLKDMMPVASGDHGTLRRRFVGTPLEGVVVGKTGTLVHDDGGMASLGGAVYTQKHGEVLFVVLNVGSSVALNRQTTDQLLADVVLSEDAPAPTQTPVAPRRQLDTTTLEIQEQ